MSNSSSTLDIACDLLVIGSGAGGLSTAITAKKHGLDVIVVEKEQVLRRHHRLLGRRVVDPRQPARQGDGADTREAVVTYMKNQTGEFYDEAAVECLPRQRAADGRVVRARDRGQVRADDVSRLPPRRARRRRHRPLDPRGAVQRAQPRPEIGAAAPAADDHHLHRHDVQLVECRPEALLQRDEVARFRGLCRQAAGEPLQGSGAVSPRRASHQRQRAGGAAGEDLLRPRHPDPYRRRSARAAQSPTAGSPALWCARSKTTCASPRAAASCWPAAAIRTTSRASPRPTRTSARRRAPVARARRQHGRRPQARRKRRRQGRPPLQGSGAAAWMPVSRVPHRAASSASSRTCSTATSPASSACCATASASPTSRTRTMTSARR